VSHASWAEAFPFTRVADLPAGSKPEPQPRTYIPAADVRQAFDDGSYGGPYLADDAVMEELFAAALGDILELLGRL